MKTLLEIKNEVAIQVYNQNWMDVELICTASLWPEVCRRAQLECAMETLKEAANNVKPRYSFKEESYVIDKTSITDESNIKLIQ